jgi:hypothetical protein
MVKYTLQSFLNNPYESTVKDENARKTFISDLLDKFHKLVKNLSSSNSAMKLELSKLDAKYRDNLKQEKIKRSIYRMANNTSVYIHLKIPSETVPGVVYDVCIEFLDAKRDLHSSLIRVFSNSLSFGFSYAYVFNKNELIIPLLINHYSKEMINNEPHIKNPKHIINYEKLLVFAMFYILNNNLMNFEVYSKEIIAIHPLNFKKRFKTISQINEIYQTKKALFAKAKREAKEKKKQETLKVDARNDLKRKTTTRTSVIRRKK